MLRRDFLRGLVAAPAIIKYDMLMPVTRIPTPGELQAEYFITQLASQCGVMLPIMMVRENLGRNVFSYRHSGFGDHIEATIALMISRNGMLPHRNDYAVFRNDGSGTIYINRDAT